MLADCLCCPICMNQSMLTVQQKLVIWMVSLGDDDFTDFQFSVTQWVKKFMLQGRPLN